MLATSIAAFLFTRRACRGFLRLTALISFALCVWLYWTISGRLIFSEGWTEYESGLKAPGPAGFEEGLSRLLPPASWLLRGLLLCFISLPARYGVMSKLPRMALSWSLARCARTSRYPVPYLCWTGCSAAEYRVAMSTAPSAVALNLNS